MSVRAEREQEEWEIAGWSRAPANGREWRMLKSGQPEPRKRDWDKAFRCRKVPSHKAYKVVWQDGKELRRCAICIRQRQREWYLANKPKQRTWASNSRMRRKEFVPVFEDGYATISATWLAENPVRVADLVRNGILIVEVYGDAAYEIHPLGKAKA